MTLRVGAVPYLVARPLLEGLEEEPQVELVLDAPANLVERLRDGSLEVALASSVELFRREGYRYVPGFGIVADGDAPSVKLFSRRPLPAIRSVAVDAASRTAAALLRALLAAWTPHRVEYREFPSDAEGPAQAADAYLRIGDRALFEEPAPGYEVTDLGRAWKELTGLPFVFALWIVRPDVDLEGKEKLLQRAARRGLRRRAAIAQSSAAETGRSPEMIREYLLERCRYDLKAPGVMEGLREFQQRAAAAGACRKDLRPRAYRAKRSPAADAARGPLPE
jgi:chorismate dehydratase